MQFGKRHFEYLVKHVFFKSQNVIYLNTQLHLKNDCKAHVFSFEQMVHISSALWPPWGSN